jgi:hypothetical protein
MGEKVRGMILVPKITHGLATSGYVGRVSLPNIIITKIEVQARFTVTDVGIVAGETFDGTINSIKLEEQASGPGRNATRFDVRRDELALLAGFLSRGPDTGKISDPLPVTAVEARAYYQLHGQWNNYGRHMELVFDMKPATDEWAGATAFVAEMRVIVDGVVPANAEEAAMMDLLIDRYEGGSLAAHPIFLTPGALLRHLVARTGTTVRRISDWALSTEGGTRIAQYPTANENDFASQEFAKWKEAAPDTQRYMYRDIDLQPNVTRKLDISIDAADTLKVWAFLLTG